MTRINCIPPSELTDAHLGAEYRELPRVFGLVARAVARGQRPDEPYTPHEYTLGAGHVLFFYAKLGYCAQRYFEVVDECKARGRVVNHSRLPPEADSIPGAWWSQWTPTPQAQALNRSRISQRLQDTNRKATKQ